MRVLFSSLRVPSQQSVLCCYHYHSLCSITPTVAHPVYTVLPLPHHTPPTYKPIYTHTIPTPQPHPHPLPSLGPVRMQTRTPSCPLFWGTSALPPLSTGSASPSSPLPSSTWTPMVEGFPLRTLRTGCGGTFTSIQESESVHRSSMYSTSSWTQLICCVVVYAHMYVHTCQILCMFKMYVRRMCVCLCGLYKLYKCVCVCVCVCVLVCVCVCACVCVCVCVCVCTAHVSPTWLSVGGPSQRSLQEGMLRGALFSSSLSRSTRCSLRWWAMWTAHYLRHWMNSVSTERAEQELHVL